MVCYVSSQARTQGKLYCINIIWSLDILSAAMMDACQPTLHEFILSTSTKKCENIIWQMTDLWQQSESQIPHSTYLHFTLILKIIIYIQLPSMPLFYLAYPHPAKWPLNRYHQILSDKLPPPSRLAAFWGVTYPPLALVAKGSREEEWFG